MQNSGWLQCRATSGLRCRDRLCFNGLYEARVVGDPGRWRWRRNGKPCCMEVNATGSGYRFSYYFGWFVVHRIVPGILNCCEAKSGQLLWQQRLEGAYAASPIFADGKIFVVNQSGVTTVIQREKPIPS